MDENQNQNENLNEKEKIPKAILPNAKKKRIREKAKIIKAKRKAKAEANKENGEKQAKGLRQKLLIGASVLATAIVLVIALVGSYNQIKPQDMGEIARSMTYNQVQPGEENVPDTNECVKFDAFFLRDLNYDGIAESIRGTCRNVKETDTLYIELKVQTNGRLENGVITINGENFDFQTSLPKDSIIRDNTIGNDIETINLKTVNTGWQKLISGTIKSNITEYDTSKYSKKGTVTLTGTYISDDGSINKAVRKEVQFDVDWHGSVRAEITNTTQYKDIKAAIDEENDELKLEFTVSTTETKEELILKKSVVEGTIPLFNEQPPIRVECTSSNVKFDYDPDTRNFTIERESVLNEDTKIVTDKISRNNNYTIKVVYPLEAYRQTGIERVELRIPVKAYYEGYNNTNSEFNNPEISNQPQSTIVLTYVTIINVHVDQQDKFWESNFTIEIGKKIYKPTNRYIVSKEKPLKIYNGLSSEEKDDNYLVTWYGRVGTNDGNKKMVMKEENNNKQICDQFIKTNGDYVSMEEVTSNIGIYFSDPSLLLGEEGEIKVYDNELDELLMTFNKDNWSRYNESNPYIYERPVKHIRVETTKANKEERLYVYNIKQLDDEYITEHYDLNAFMELEYINSTLCGYLEDELVKLDSKNVKYEAPYATASIYLDKDTISTQSTEKNMNITIQATAIEDYNQARWQNGVFLAKLPNIVDVEINDVRSTNSNVEILSFEQYKEGENCYIKIKTENSIPTTFDVVINCDITPDPRKITQTEKVELYYYNENAVDYWNKTADEYDLNGNLNKKENIGKTDTDLNLVSPNSLLTCETITEYDNKTSVTVAPQIALVEKNQKTATINVQINNNYNSTISEVKILGRIPHTENKYVISGENLGSEFDTTMQGTLTLPERLKSIAKVYYSDNIYATEDVTLETNNWQQYPKDFTNIKSYLIDLGDNKINQNDKYEISYTVSIPTGLTYNQVTFSHHAVYFSLDTEHGKYKTQTEPNKVGIMIAKQYDIELIKYQLGRNNTVPGATYLIKEENAKDGKTRTTNSSGTLTLTNLYVDRTYVIKEIKSPADYELNEAEIKFKVTEDGEALKLVDEVTVNGNSKSIKVIGPQDDGKYKVEVQVEDEVKAILKIVKTKKGNPDTKLKGVRFKITGKNYEDGKNITTNINGEASLNGLSIGEEYTLEEVKADGYYLASPIKVIINNDGNENYIASITEDNGQNLVVENTTTGADAEIPAITLKIENEKIPEYTLKINKVVKGKTEPLAGVKFRLFKGTEKIKDYTTNDIGNITIENLYQYEETRQVDQTYTLKEISAPDGYAKVKDITFFVTKNAEGSLIMEIKEGKIKEQTVENETNTVTLTIEDSPSFKLIKKDGETETPLPGTKFAIYNVDTGEEQLALDSKYNILGEREEINGKTYYTLTTNEQGEIEADLREGLYKAVEIQANNEKYDITNNEYYFGIGQSREARKSMSITFESNLNINELEKVLGTSDGGYIVGGSFTSKITIGEDVLTSYGGADGLLIKYGADNNVEWAKSIGGTSYDVIYSVEETSNGEYIVLARFTSSNVIVENEPIKRNGEDGILIIKYSSNGNFQWVKSIGGKYQYQNYPSVSATSDGGFILGVNLEGKKGDTINIENRTYTITSDANTDQRLNNVLIIKYGLNGNVEWENKFEGNLNKVKQTRDGGYIAGVNSKLIKYNAEGKVELVPDLKDIENFQISDLLATSDGGYIVRDNNEGELIKFSSTNELEWISEKIDSAESGELTSMIQTNDGGYLIGGCYRDAVVVGPYIFTR